MRASRRRRRGHTGSRPRPRGRRRCAAGPSRAWRVDRAERPLEDGVGGVVEAGRKATVGRGRPGWAITQRKVAGVGLSLVAPVDKAAHPGLHVGVVGLERVQADHGPVPHGVEDGRDGGRGGLEVARSGQGGAPASMADHLGGAVQRGLVRARARPAPSRPRGGPATPPRWRPAGRPRGVVVRPVRVDQGDDLDGLGLERAGRADKIGVVDHGAGEAGRDGERVGEQRDRVVEGGDGGERRDAAGGGRAAAGSRRARCPGLSVRVRRRPSRPRTGNRVGSRSLVQDGAVNGLPGGADLVVMAAPPALDNERFGPAPPASCRPRGRGRRRRTSASSLRASGRTGSPTFRRR